VYLSGANNPPPLRTITSGLSAPTGIAVDAAHNFYICSNAGHAAGPRGQGKGTWDVTVYKRGRKTPFETYTDGVWNPVDVAIAADGTVFIANISSAVTVYPSGTLHPSRSLVGPSGQSPLGLAFDGAGNTFVSYVAPGGGSGGSIYEYAPGQNTGTNLGIVFSGSSPHGLAIDRQGNLIVAASKAPSPGSDIEVYAPGQTQPKQKISGVFQPFMLALSADGHHLFAADFGSGNNDGAVFKYDYPSGKLVTKDNQGAAASAYGVALDQ
jgi:sugar lactone lactonase YvrE